LAHIKNVIKQGKNKNMRGYATYSEFLKDNEIERAIDGSFRSVAEFNPEGGGGSSAFELPAVASAENQAIEVAEALENAQSASGAVVVVHPEEVKIPHSGVPNSLTAAGHVAPKADAVQPNKAGDDAERRLADVQEPQPEINVDGAGNDDDNDDDDNDDTDAAVTDANDDDNDDNSDDDDDKEPAVPGVENNITNEISEANGNTNSSDANSNSNLDGKAGIDGRAPEKYGTSGQNNSADIEFF
jgi:hypothetical protein